VEDDEWPGRLVTMRNFGNVEKLRTDRRLVVGMTAEELNVDKKKMVKQILTNLNKEM
jgi:hypothetical protein